MDEATERPPAPSATTTVPPNATERYRAQVERVYNSLSLTGLPERDPRLNQLPLSDIFVPLSIEIDSPQPDPVLDDRMAAIEESTRSHPSLRDRVLTDMHLRQRVPPAPLPMPLGEALVRYRRLVIVGAPGSGKTTLLRWLAVTFAAGRQAQPDRLGPGFATSYLPVVLELRRFVDRFRALTEQPGTFDLAAEASSFIAQDARFAGTARETIYDAIIGGNCIILLDGLDEIADQATRRRLIEAIEALCADPGQRAAGNLCLLTTRPHGFTNLALGAGFQTVTIRPFDPQDVATFTRTWYRVAYGGEALAEEAQHLVAEIKDNERVASLATNPLLCTIIVIVYRNNRVLPERRVELYLKCCEALLDTWERNKDIQSSGLIGGFGWQIKLELLAALAYWMHSETERLAAAEDLVVQQIAAALVADQLAQPAMAADEARRFVDTIRDRAGLLRGRGDGTLEFSHRTFQEYLSARHLATLDDDAMLDEVMPRLHAAWWTEVHLLLLGHLGNGKENSGRVERLLVCILDAPRRPLPFLMPPPYRWLWPIAPGRWFPGWQRNARIGRMLGRDLALAIAGYCQCAPTATSAFLTERLAADIARTVRHWRKHTDLVGTSFRSLVETINREGRRSRLRSGFTAALLDTLRDSDASVRGAAAQALGPAAAADSRVVTVLLDTLRDSDASVRGAAAQALGPAAAADPRMVTALLDALRDSNNFVRGAAAQALGPAAAADSRVVTVLLDTLRDSDDFVRGAAAQALGPAAAADPRVVTALLDTLRDSDGFVQWSAAQALGPAAAADPRVVTALLDTLRDSDDFVRGAAAQALGPAAASDSRVVTVLLDTLRDSDDFMRGAAAQALGPAAAAAADPRVVTALLDTLRDSDGFVQWSAAQALGHAAAADPRVVTALLDTLRDSDAHVRRSAARALGPAAASDPRAVTALLDTLRDSKAAVRWAAAQALGPAAAADPATMSRILARLRGFAPLKSQFWPARIL